MAKIALILVPAIAAVLWLQVEPARAGRVPCTKVISEVNRRVTRGMTKKIDKMAKKLGTDAGWIRHCMTINGRRFDRVVSGDFLDEDGTELDPNGTAGPEED